MALALLTCFLAAVVINARPILEVTEAKLQRASRQAHTPCIVESRIVSDTLQVPQKLLRPFVFFFKRLARLQVPIAHVVRDLLKLRFCRCTARFQQGPKVRPKSF